MYNSNGRNNKLNYKSEKFLFPAWRLKNFIFRSHLFALPAAAATTARIRGKAKHSKQKSGVEGL